MNPNKEVLLLEKIKLNIIFHNPNTSVETVTILTKLAAEVAKSKIVNAISNINNDIESPHDKK